MIFTLTQEWFNENVKYFPINNVKILLQKNTPKHKTWSFIHMKAQWYQIILLGLGEKMDARKRQ